MVVNEQTPNITGCVPSFYQEINGQLYAVYAIPFNGPSDDGNVQKD